MDETEDAGKTTGRRGARPDAPGGEGAMLIRLARVRPGGEAAESTAVRADGAAVPAPAQPDRIPLPRRIDVVRGARTNGTLDDLIASRQPRLPGAIIAFLLVVVLPTILAALYSLFAATPQYTSEFRFAVRSSQEGVLTDLTARMAAVNPMSVMADNFLVAEFAESRDVVDALEETVGLRRAYGGEQIDWLSRFDRSGSAERLVRYWAGKVDAHFDMTTGINVIAVRAFSPEDAHTIARALQRLCVELVNGISEKARLTQMRYAEDQVTRAEEKVRQARARELEFRKRVKTVDASQAASAQLALAARIEGTLSTLRTEFDMVSKYLEPGSPRLKVLRDLIESNEAQLAIINGRVGRVDPQGAGAVTDAVTLSEYEYIKTDLTLALEIYEAALTSYEQARLKAVTDQLFLATFVQPARPEEPSHPKVLRDTLMVFLCALALWVMGALLFYSVRDHAP